jgi:cytochrome b561/polyisoprenoid-binding protein YceI
MTDLRDETSPTPPLSERTRYSRWAMLLHWTIAACFAFQIGLGWQMDGPRGPQTFAVYQLHKSVGIAILLLTLARLGWRLASPAPAYPATMRRWEKRLSRSVHFGFYVLLLGLPLTGWLLVSASKVAVPTLLFGTVPWPHVPGIAGLAPGAKGVVEEASEIGHHVLIYISYLLLFLHVAGALKHQFLERGGDLARMMPAPPRALGAAAIGAVLAFAALTAIGSLVRLSPVALASPTAPPATPTPLPAAIPSSPATVPTPAVAPTPEPSATPTATPTPVAPSRWALRKAASSIGFHTRWSEGPVDGRFGTWDAAILFDPDALDASSVKVTIDMASATTNNDDTQGALPDPDWFAAATHPTATFAAKRFRHRGGNRYEAIGTLAIRGVSRPLTLPFTLTIAGDVATMTGTATIDRTLFGVGQGEWAATTDLPAGVQLAVAVKADRAK